MYNKIIFILSWGIFTISIISAQTTIPGGNVSGTWTAAGSPYRIMGNITVTAGNTLTIEPAVDVEFQGGYSLTVKGYLQAIGTETDSIHFFPADTSWGWHGITFYIAPDGSHLVYCTISNCDLPVHCFGSSPVISHSTITAGKNGAITAYFSGSPEISHCNLMYNQSPVYHSAICWESLNNGTISDCIISHNSNGCGIMLGSTAHLTIIDCIISDNTNNDRGGGVRSDLGTLTLINCIISDNSASNYHGGGVSCTNSSATFTNCTINGNTGGTSATPTQGGGGISLYNANGTLSYCTISDNYSNEYGGGIAITNGNLTIDHCTIDGNATMGIESGVSIVGGATADITNSIISNNYDGYGIYNSGTLTVGSTDFFNNTTGSIYGNIPTGFRQHTQVNTNGDSCDVYSNIFLDPMFVGGDDFHLTEDSPCIDAGDPNSPLDPDNTIADIGALYYDQLQPTITTSDSLLNFGIVDIGQQLDLPLSIRNCGTSILHIKSISNQQAEYTTNWNPADTLILPGDSLIITVSFWPLDSGLIVDTLVIENNIRSLQVELTGTGNIVIGIEDKNELPKVYTLHPAYPNPFNSSTKIEFDLPRQSYVILKVYTILGEEVSTLISKEMLAGKFNYIWNAENLTSGIYLYQLNAGEFNRVRKITLLR